MPCPLPISVEEEGRGGRLSPPLQTWKAECKASLFSLSKKKAEGKGLLSSLRRRKLECKIVFSLSTREEHRARLSLALSRRGQQRARRSPPLCRRESLRTRLSSPLSKRRMRARLSLPLSKRRRQRPILFPPLSMEEEGRRQGPLFLFLEEQRKRQSHCEQNDFYRDQNDCTKRDLFNDFIKNFSSYTNFSVLRSRIIL